MKLSKALYGFAFVFALPALMMLWAWAAEPNITLPAYGGAPGGVAFPLAGGCLMLLATRDLWTIGGGLPMNAFPPPHLVKVGIFRLLPHPIYTGFVLVCLGVSMAARSRAGLWLVTPCAMLGCAALVLGYERPDLLKRFGNTLHVLPAVEDTRPSTSDRLRFYLVAVIPWIALYEITIQMRLRGTSFGFGFEDQLAIWPWTALIYQSIYVAVAVAPWCARTRRDLRQLTISAWVASGVVFLLYWVMPSGAPRRPLASAGWIIRVLQFERNTYPPVAAFPSFHVLWVIFLARLFRRRWLGIAYVAAISISCVTTGMHYIADVGAALLISPLFLYPARVWELLRTGSERLANSWREWRIGPVRIINHGAYAGLGAFVQVSMVMAAAGPGRTFAVLATSSAGLVGAAMWAQWVEGGSRLRRPFGFYGGLIAVGTSCLFLEDRWILLGAHCLAAPWLQAVGRLRCLVNGCCHGAPAPDEVGIAVVESHSRVTRLAQLAGVPIYPTQLYSILGNVCLGVLLLRLWLSNCPLSLICGAYALGNGFARFVEEAYRGEPQTMYLWGLRLYQWMAIASVLTGAILTSLASPTAPELVPSAGGYAWAAVFAVVTSMALGVDFPESDRTFARLT